MVSQRKIEANRRNGRKGCGPRTVVGKLRSCANARKHGLSVSVLIDAKLQATALQLAHAIAGKNADDGVLAQALIVAETELTLQRIRRARVALIEMAMAKTGAGQAPDSVAPSAPQPNVGAEVETFVKALPTLSSMERYERRAYSRGKKALQCFNDLQQIAQLKS